ncbi:MAG TPA: cell division protein FtsL [Pyrinomonadaceae bacterium]|nr:cell division protein FtsL [Pyrinomonadaceae bacterium]
MVRRLPSKHRNAPVGREKDKDAFFRLGLLLVVGLALTCGFVYAGRQHFAALKFGYETENLRRKRDQLAEDKRRLTLQREEAANPARLEQLAKQLGMQTLQPAQVDPLRQGANNSQTVETLTVRKDAKPGKRETEKNPKAVAKPAAKSQRKPI